LGAVRLFLSWTNRRGWAAKRGYCEINFHSRDLRIAYYIKKVIGGNIYKYKKVNGCRYYCTNKQDLTFISNLILNKLRLVDKITQFNTRLAARVNSEFSKISTRAISMHNFWFAGFVQGDGSFQIKIRKKQKSKGTKLKSF
jgi:hypothetical protein